MRSLAVRLDAAGYLGLALVLGVVAVVALGPLVSGQDPIATNPLNAFSPPSAQHWFGTDDLGRDVFTRVAVGGRYSLTSGVLVVILVVCGGRPAGRNLRVLWWTHR